MSFPLNFLGMLGKGLPSQDGTQQAAQAAANQRMAGGGVRPRRAVSPFQPTGSPVASPLDAPDASPIEMPNSDPTGTGSDTLQGRAAINYVPQSPQMGAPPLPPTVENPRLRALQQQLSQPQIDPRTVADQQLSHRGLGSKVLGGVIGAVQALGGRGGIFPGIQSGIRGDDQRNAIMQQQAQQNAARRQAILDQFQLEKEIGGEQYKQGEQDIQRGNLANSGRTLDETIRYHDIENQQKADQARADAARYGRQDETTRRGQDTGLVEHQITAGIPSTINVGNMPLGTVKPDDPRKNIVGTPQYGDSGQAYYNEYDPATKTVITKKTGGARKDIQFAPSGGSGGKASKPSVSDNRDDATLRRNAHDQAVAHVRDTVRQQKVQETIDSGIPADQVKGYLNRHNRIGKMVDDEMKREENVRQVEGLRDQYYKQSKGK